MRPEWKRIAGLHISPESDIGAVWLAHDTASDVIHIYDACIFRREVFAVIAEGINARGRFIPIAWESKAKDMNEKLLSRGCRMLPDSIKESQSLAEVQSREILERMKTGRLKVDKRLSEWLDEYSNYYRQDAQIPIQSSPLMSATRYGVSEIKYGRRVHTPSYKNMNYIRVAIV